MTAATPADAPATQPHPTCSTCGAIAADAVPVTWSAAVEGARRQWTCDRCAREHVRNIEAKLDSSWW